MGGTYNKRHRRAGRQSGKQHGTHHHRTRNRATALIADAGERARLRFVDFFTAHIRNPNTRAAYGVAVREFFAWLQMQDLTELREIRTHHVSTYIEMLTHGYSAPTVKQHLAAIRRLFDWLIVGQIVGQNPTAPVRAQPHRQERQDAGAPR